MGIQRLHSKFDTLFNGVNSKNYLSYTPEEKDLLLYKASFTLIEEFRQIRKNNISGNDDNFSNQEFISLFRKEKKLSCYNENLTTVTCQLPIDFLSLENISCTAIYNCGKKLTNQKNIKLYKTIVPLGSFYNESDFSFEIKDDNTTLYSSRSVKGLNFYQNLNSEYENYVAYAIQPLLDELANSSYEVYYENYGNNFYENSLIFISNSPLRLAYDKNGIQAIYNSKETIKESYEDTEMTTKLRIVPVEKVSNYQNSYYGKSTVFNPFGYISNGKLFIKTDLTFTIKSLEMAYLKKPNFPNFYLGKSLINGLSGLTERFEDTLIDSLTKVIPTHLINN